MFIRDGVLHFILVDHYIFQQADPGGGERRDPRDTKGGYFDRAASVQAAFSA
ncbi:MAG: hypothetical protein U0231_16200 [Nitrospiraceae bacterium]